MTDQEIKVKDGVPSHFSLSLSVCLVGDLLFNETWTCILCRGSRDYSACVLVGFWVGQ